MKILITGSNGLLGQKIVHRWAEKPDFELIATARGENRIQEVTGFEYCPMDITNRENVRNVVTKYLPDAIIHTAAMTNVDQCEDEKELCLQMNVNAVQYLLEICEEKKIHIIHLSTDFILTELMARLQKMLSQTQFLSMASPNWKLKNWF